MVNAKFMTSVGNALEGLDGLDAAARARVASDINIRLGLSNAPDDVKLRFENGKWKIGDVDVDAFLKLSTKGRAGMFDDLLDASTLDDANRAISTNFSDNFDAARVAGQPGLDVVRVNIGDDLANPRNRAARDALLSRAGKWLGYGVVTVAVLTALAQSQSGCYLVNVDTGEAEKVGNDKDSCNCLDPQKAGLCCNKCRADGDSVVCPPNPSATWTCPQSATAARVALSPAAAAALSTAQSLAAGPTATAPLAAPKTLASTATNASCGCKKSNWVLQYRKKGPWDVLADGLAGAGKMIDAAGEVVDAVVEGVTGLGNFFGSLTGILITVGVVIAVIVVVVVVVMVVKKRRNPLGGGGGCWAGGGKHSSLLGGGGCGGNGGKHSSLLGGGGRGGNGGDLGMAWSLLG